MYQIYQIMQGDSLEIIASKFNTTPNNLVSINGLSGNLNLVPGGYLVVPKVEDGAFYRYTVKKGDNLYSLAGRFGASVDVLEMLNGLEKNEYIYPNQELLIPKEGVLVYVTKDETLEDISMQSGIDVGELASQNQQLYVVPGQIAIYKDNKNE